MVKERASRPIWSSRDAQVLEDLITGEGSVKLNLVVSYGLVIFIFPSGESNLGPAM